MQEAPRWVHIVKRSADKIMIAIAYGVATLGQIAEAKGLVNRCFGKKNDHDRMTHEMIVQEIFRRPDSHPLQTSLHDVEESMSWAYHQLQQEMMQDPTLRDKINNSNPGLELLVHGFHL